MILDRATIAMMNKFVLPTTYQSPRGFPLRKTDRKEQPFRLYARSLAISTFTYTSSKCIS